jgi:DNA-binding XRE family transcriptional regulator/HPt (histidine-containing phosphotransfer) domain-containing protein
MNRPPRRFPAPPVAVPRPSPTGDAFTLERGITPRPAAPPALPEPIESERLELIATGSSAVYHGLRSRMHAGAFREYDGSPFPISPINEPSVKGQIELKPLSLDDFPALPPDDIAALAGEMWKYASELSELDADVMDAICHAWLTQARTLDAKAIVDIDTILQLRGIKPKKGGSGRRGGYMPEQRQNVLQTLSRLQSLWLQLDEAPDYQAGKGKKPRSRSIASRAFTFSDVAGHQRIDGGIDIDRVAFVPGTLLALYLQGIGRQTALLSAKALRYDPYRQAPEKALTRYLSYLWRVRATKGTYRQPLRVATLLENGRIALDERPDRKRNRLEKALDTLQADGVIASWRYDGWELGTAPARGWVPNWLQALVIIEPPASIPAHYAGELRGGMPMLADPRPLPERMNATRTRLRLSQEAAAEACGLAQQTYSRAERGASLSAENRGKIEAWLTANTLPSE